jgi:hypothetical protein
MKEIREVFSSLKTVAVIKSHRTWQTKQTRKAQSILAENSSEKKPGGTN